MAAKQQLDFDPDVSHRLQSDLFDFFCAELKGEVVRHICARTRRETHDCQGHASEKVSLRGEEQSEMLKAAVGTTGPYVALDAPGRGSALYGAGESFISTGADLGTSASAVRILPPPHTGQSLSSKGRLVSQLHSSSDQFESVRGDVIDEDVAAGTCELLQDYSPGRRVHETLLLDIVRPIVGLNATALCETVCAMAIMRQVLRAVNTAFRTEERVQLAQNAAGLMSDLVTSLLHQRGGEPTLRYGRDRLLSALPEQKQVEILSSLSEEEEQGMPAWRTFAMVNFPQEETSINTAHHLWFLLVDNNFTVGGLYSHLIAAGQLKAAHYLEE